MSLHVCLCEYVCTYVCMHPHAVGVRTREGGKGEKERAGWADGWDGGHDLWAITSLLEIPNEGVLCVTRQQGSVSGRGKQGSVSGRGRLLLLSMRDGNRLLLLPLHAQAPSSLLKRECVCVLACMRYLQVEVIDAHLWICLGAECVGAHGVGGREFRGRMFVDHGGGYQVG